MTVSKPQYINYILTADDLIKLVRDGDPYTHLLIAKNPQVAEAAMRKLLNLPE